MALSLFVLAFLLFGHAASQAPQDMHKFASTSAFPFTSLIAFTGQTLTQTAFPVHFDLLTIAVILLINQ